jgi:signal recognition particle GTPase
VRYIGIGERPDDLRDFDASEFVEAMLGQSSSSTDVAA